MLLQFKVLAVHECEGEKFLSIHDTETGVSILAKVEIETMVPQGKDIPIHLWEDYEDCPKY